ncbi:MAG: right-handed parallel beta-helix repeat-containing protein [Phycisphaeraceae bacterium]|nr:right-handed parallel beta-helix repeat-containing protein [Phycisphaeraceae bacterium]
MRPSTLAAGGLAAAFTALLVIAGPLDPPAGPVQPTPRTLAEIEPRTPIGPDTTPGDANALFRITQPGSYYLASDAVGEAGKHGIEVFTPFAEGVVIDLNGFSLRGVPGSRSGIVVQGGTIVRNGVIEQWDEDGLSAGQAIVEHVTASFNGRDGIRVLSGGIVRECVAQINQRDGISVADTSRIDRCVSKNNKRYGVHADGAATVTDCLLYANEGGGIETGLSIVSDCELFSNSQAAILDRGFSTILRNKVFNGAQGILVTGDSSRIEDNHVLFCVTGIDVDGEGSLIIRNSVAQCTAAFDIAAGNTAGPIVDAATIGADSNPHANYAP